MQNAHGSRTVCEDTVDSHMHPADQDGLSKDLHHIILPQVQHLQYILYLHLKVPLVEQPAVF